MNIKINNNLLDIFIKLNANQKNSNKIDKRDSILVLPSSGELFTVISTMKIGKEVASQLSANIISIPEYKSCNKVRRCMASFSSLVLNTKLGVVLAMIMNPIKMIKIFSITRGESLLCLKYKSASIGVHMYDMLLRRNIKATISELSFKDRAYNLFNYAYIIYVDKVILKKSPHLVVITDNTHRLGMLFELLREYAIPCITGIDTSGLSMHYYRTSNDYNFHCRTPDKFLVDKLLSDSQCLSLAQIYLDRRISGSELQHDALKAYDKKKKKLTLDVLTNKFGYNPSKKVFLVAAHAFTDSPHAYPGTLFDDYYQWIIATCKALNKNKNIIFLVKEHPSFENYHESGWLSEILDSIGCKDRYLSSEVNTSSLFDLVDVIVTCGGTAGMEFPCFGVPVVIASKPPYYHYGFVTTFKSANAYIKYLEEVVNVPKLSSNDLLTAKIVLFYVNYLIKVEKKELGFGSQKFTLDTSVSYKIVLEEFTESLQNQERRDLFSSHIHSLLFNDKYNNIINYAALPADIEINYLQ